MFVVLTGLATSAPAWAVASPAPASLELEVNGEIVAVPTLKTDVDARIDGDLATVHLVQTFENPTDAATNARYVFPLPEDAAVYAMTMRTATGVVIAEIRRREEAAAVYEQAKLSGLKAALLDQERPNVFTQQVANLGPHEKVQIELSYAHAVDRIDGTWTWTLPMVVGPRYVPPESTGSAASRLPENQWSLQPTDVLPRPAQIDPGRVAVTVHLAPGTPFTAAPSSPTHPLRVANQAGGDTVATLAGERTVDNKDLVLTWRTAGATPTVATAASADAGHGVVELLIEPMAAPAPSEVAPRELVFVLDTSCSMDGFPLDASKALMKRALRSLAPTDRFRIVKFSTRASELADHPLPADRETVDRAIAWVDRLSADGGTEVIRGLDKAFGGQPAEHAVRDVVLVTDGYIGNEAEVISHLDRVRGDARVFSLGIGSSVNRYLVEEVARAGRGVARVVLDPSQAEPAADALMERLAAPVLTDLAIDWGGAPVRDMTPAHLPDLIAGQPVRVLARFDAAGTWPITVRGRVNGQAAVLPVSLTLPKAAPGRDALGLTWARAEIADRQIDRLRPTATLAELARLQEEITVLGLEYGLVTDWTSFVAVSKTDAAITPTAGVADVATPLPEGVPASAFTNGPVLGGSTGGDSLTLFGGSAAPEPATWLAGLLALGLGGLASRKRRPSRADVSRRG